MTALVVDAGIHPPTGLQPNMPREVLAAAAGATMEALAGAADRDAAEGCRFAPGTMGSTFFADPRGLPEFLRRPTRRHDVRRGLEAARRGLSGRSKAPLRHEVRAISWLWSVVDAMDEVRIGEYISKRSSQHRRGRRPDEWPPGRRPHCG